MNNQIYKLLIALYLLLTVQPILAQNNHETTNTTATPIDAPYIDGSFFINLKSHDLLRSDLEQNLNAYFSLSDQYSFQPFHESEDQLGFTHAAYQQFYQGVLVEDGMALLHSKDGIMSSINGRVIQLPQGFSLQAKLNESKATTIAQK